jgi:alanyl-tRNA synthetase
LSKEELIAKFSSDADKYYRVSLFDDLGFIRQECRLCKGHFWSINARDRCPNCEPYSFIGNPPTSKRLDYIQAWRAVEEFFVSNGHTSIRRYPVVCRWREDLFFTVASIVDFQRVIGGKVVFELPANPLIVPQICLRFNDIENVGVTGKHYTSFCMIGQHSIANEQGYWKDRCIELDYKMLTNVLGINKEEIVFVEDVWLGYGAFGYSLEYYVRGLELGNAVFTEFEGSPKEYKVMDERVVDMGAGLERFSWVTMGTPTSYDCTFGPVINYLINKFGVEYDTNLLSDYFTLVSSGIEHFSLDKYEIARRLGVDYDKLVKITTQLEVIYALADHTRTLTFAIADGALPSNTGGGYNLRVVLRRILSMLNRLQWSIRLEEIADMHIDYLHAMYPELREQRESVRTILNIESKRYADSLERMKSIVKRLSSNKGKRLTEDDLVKLYESDGITPDLLKEYGIEVDVKNFYTRIAERHNAKPLTEEPKPIIDIKDLEPTYMLFYDDQYMLDFTARVVKIKMPYIILDRTAFYARSGGQEPDHGYIEDARVIDVIKEGDVILHKVQEAEIGFKEGDIVRCKVDAERRGLIMRHHTATHIVNAACRRVLGDWVWQHSAFKDEHYARLDVTHHSPLSREEIKRIEEYANDVVLKDVPIEVSILDRGKAEQLYGFRIYQGGYVPSSKIRIVNIKDWDIEACAGTHCKSTGEIGMIKIIRTERVQDGIVRLEYVAGKAALRYAQTQEDNLLSIANVLGSPKDKVVETFLKKVKDGDDAKRMLRLMIKKVAEYMAKDIINNAKVLYDKGFNTKLCLVYEDKLDEEYHIAVGEKAIELDPTLVYCAIISKNDEENVRIIVFSGSKARERFKANIIAKSIANMLKGSAGGNDRFAQGGGSRTMLKGILDRLEEIILATVQ